MSFKKLVPFRDDSYLRVMKMSIPFAQDCFARFNDLCFNGVLPAVPMVLTSATSFLGKLRYSKVGRRLMGTRNVDFQIRLSSEFDLTAEEWEDVIIHEMIHLYIASGHMKDSSSHGRIFRTMMNEINSKYGRHIVVSHRIKPSDDSPRLTRSRLHSIFVSTFPDGERGVTVCSATMAQRIRFGLRNSYALTSIRWYVSDDAFFNRFPHSRLPRIYMISPEELDAHLVSAIEIYDTNL